MRIKHLLNKWMWLIFGLIGVFLGKLLKIGGVSIPGLVYWYFIPGVIIGLCLQFTKTWKKIYILMGAIAGFFLPIIAFKFENLQFLMTIISVFLAPIAFIYFELEPFVFGLFGRELSSAHGLEVFNLFPAGIISFTI
ncbi:hypothetical protein HYS50_02565, partial [Candidatus Woesearchaeota archaeon]|nr:hypothetical protein [Candidatus Woesearchaeota archaeon]